MEIRQLTTEMLEFRLGSDPEIDPEWFVAHLDDIIRFDPQGCFALCDGETVVGMITSTVYQSIGWLGWLFVLEEYRGQGLGEKLMNRGVEHIRSRGIKTILLEADIKAISLYRRLGFAEQFSTQHYCLTRGDFKCGSRREVQVTPVVIDELAAVARFDQKYFHEDRRSMFEIVAQNSAFRGFVARDESVIVGYMFTTEAADNQQVGPLVIDLSHKFAKKVTGALFREALKACPKPLYFRCPLIVDGYSDVLMNLGATRVDYRTVRMYLGDSYKAEQKGVFSLGCPGKG